MDPFRLGTFFDRPYVSLWVERAKVHYNVAQRQLGFAFLPYLNEERTPESVNAMKNFLVGVKSAFGESADHRFTGSVCPTQRLEISHCP